MALALAAVASSAWAGRVPLWPILYYRSPLATPAEGGDAAADGTYRLWVLWPLFHLSDDGLARRHALWPLLRSYRSKADGDEMVGRLSVVLGLIHSSSVDRSTVGGELATSEGTVQPMAEERRVSVLTLFRSRTIRSPREGRTFLSARSLFPLCACQVVGDGSEWRLALLDPLEQLWWQADRCEGERRWSALLKMMGHSRAASGERRWHCLWGLVSYRSDGRARRLRLLFLPPIPLGRRAAPEGS